MIPKKIHYCWFGGKPLPPLAERCIASWKKYCPDYEIIRWDESNYDVTKNEYMRQAYEAKKWGFVSDYARKDIIYQYGGIYLDTDVEIIRPFDGFLENEAFMGLESPGGVNTGIGFGAEARHPIIREMLEIYQDISFVYPDGTYNLTPCGRYEDVVLHRNGLIGENVEQDVKGIHIYPTDYFCPKSGYHSNIEITKNTHSIHHYVLSWAPWHKRIRGKVYWGIRKVFGSTIADFARKMFGKG